MGGGLFLQSTTGLIALAQSSGDTDEPTFDTLRWTISADVKSFNPFFPAPMAVRNVLRQIYEPLVTITPDGTIQGVLAESWFEVPNSGGKSWDFVLRENVRFHNGYLFTPQDVIYSLIQHQQLMDARVYREISDVQEQNARTVRITTLTPQPYLPYQLYDTLIASRRWVKSFIDQRFEVDLKYTQDANQYVVADAPGDYWRTRANGTGPYQLSGVSDDDVIQLDYFPDYWLSENKQPAVKTVRINTVVNDASRLNDLLRRFTDLVTDLPPVLPSYSLDAPFLSISTVPSNRVVMLALRIKSSSTTLQHNRGEIPLRNIAVRTAIDKVLDRALINRALFSSRGKVTGSLIPPDVFGYTDALSQPPIPDILEAQSLLVRAGYGEGISLTMACPIGHYSGDVELCRQIVAMLGEIGISITLKSYSPDQYFDLIINQTPDLFILGWSESSYQSLLMLEQLAVSDGDWNLVGLSDINIDQRIKNLTKPNSLEGRRNVLRELWRDIDQKKVYIPMYQAPINWGYLNPWRVVANPQGTVKIQSVTVEK